MDRKPVTDRSRLLLWGLAALSLVVFCIALPREQILPNLGWFTAAVALAGAAEDRARRKRRTEWFEAEFGSVAGLLQAVDAEELRRVRDEQGTVHAVRALRRQYPKLPLETAVQAVERL
jgi:hypothetical protein